MFKHLLLINLYVSLSIDILFDYLLLNDYNIFTNYITNTNTRQIIEKNIGNDIKKRERNLYLSIHNIEVLSLFIRIYQLSSLFAYFEYNNYNYNIHSDPFLIFLSLIVLFGLIIIVNVYNILGRENYYYGYILDKELILKQKENKSFKILCKRDYINLLITYNYGLLIYSIGFYLLLNEIIFFENSTYLFLNLSMFKSVLVLQNIYFMVY
jgi:hypothetical protein